VVLTMRRLKVSLNIGEKLEDCREKKDNLSCFIYYQDLTGPIGSLELLCEV
jgi:hypothetical protein